MAANDDIWVVYDGECLLCNAFVLRYRIQQVVRQMHLIDARMSDPLVDEVRRAGLDLDSGMVVKLKGRFYHGADAINALAILGSDNTLFNRINRALFRRPQVARLIYPLLVQGRLLLLRILGRSPIGALPVLHDARSHDH
ncbi:MAG: DCC1-like thiol-disulfide oxidoreductase family protein [Stellaceae bacterium]